jgi:hypothetical protein
MKIERILDADKSLLLAIGGWLGRSNNTHPLVKKVEIMN